MNRLMNSIVSLIVLGAMAMPALAQDGPPGAPGGPGGGGANAGGGPGGGGPRRGGGGPNGGGGGGGPGFDGGGPGGPMGPEMRRMEILRDYLDVVDRFTRMSRDPSTAGVAAVISASDLLKPRGPEAAIEYFNKILPDVKNEAVQRAIKIQLIDLYKQANQSDKALEQLDALIKAAPAGSAPEITRPPAP